MILRWGFWFIGEYISIIPHQLPINPTQRYMWILLIASDTHHQMYTFYKNFKTTSNTCQNIKANR